ncbi:MAG: hypothetical protein GEU80_05940 [Dehalococcoidia bacterium]|nr:hypothetical protein [Dehalococcoidia bacterium]
MTSDDWALRHFRNYVSAFRLAVEGCYGTDWRLGLHERVLTGWSTDAERRMTAEKRARASQLMRAAWYTEYQLRWPLAAPEAIEFANQWAVVQTYYAVSSAAQVAILVVTDNEAKNHQSFLNQMSDWAANRLPYPLSTRCVRYESPEVRGLSPSFRREKGLVAAAVPTHANAEQYLFTAVRTTRENQVDERGKEWLAKRPGRVRLSPGYRAQQDSDPKLRPTTFFNFLWEMRRRANYGGADVFVAGGIGRADHTALLEGLAFLTDFTLTVFESAVAARGHSGLLQEAMDSCRLGATTLPPLGERAALWGAKA